MENQPITNPLGITSVNPAPISQPPLPTKVKTNLLVPVLSTIDDNKYIAVINYAESMGDETLTLLNTDGKIIKEFGHLESPQTLVPFYWTDHFYWISMGIPIGDPVGVIRINADNLKVDRYLSKQ